MKEQLEKQQLYESTAAVFEGFLKSTVWHDIREALLDRLEVYTETLCNHTKVIDELRFAQGAIAEIKHLAGLPEAILEDLKLIAKEKSND